MDEKHSISMGFSLYLSLKIGITQNAMTLWPNAGETACHAKPHTSEPQHLPGHSLCWRLSERLQEAAADLWFLMRKTMGKPQENDGLNWILW